MHLGNGYLQTPAALVRSIRREVARGQSRQRWSVLIDRQGEVQLCSGSEADIQIARCPSDLTLTITAEVNPSTIARAVMHRLTELIPERSR